jgi:hypothetical protein
MGGHRGSAAVRDVVAAAVEAAPDHSPNILSFLQTDIGKRFADQQLEKGGAAPIFAHFFQTPDHARRVMLTLCGDCKGMVFNPAQELTYETPCHVTDFREAAAKILSDDPEANARGNRQLNHPVCTKQLQR